MNRNEKIKKVMPIAAMIVSGICLAGMCICLYFNGYFRDEYVPDIVEIPEMITYGMWLLPVGILLSIVAVIVSMSTSSKSLKRICGIYWVILILITCAFFVYAYHMQKSYPI